MPKMKKPKRTKARVKPPREALSNVCHVTGLGAGVAETSGGWDDNVLDCLDALASAQGQGGPSSSPSNAAAANDSLVGEDSPPPPPPGLQQIPNLRLELARHLHAQNLSTFLLQACPGLRMPTFERWLLDSKLEEAERLHSIIDAWLEDPSLKLAQSNAGGKAKKKYGRAAAYQQKNDERNDEQNAQHEREKSRRENDCKLLLAADKRTPARTARSGHASLLLRTVARDPILPYHAMETDPSCDRLLHEIMAASSDAAGEEADPQHRRKRGSEVVRELCQKSSDTCQELRHLEQRLSKFQKLGGEAGSKTKRKRAGGSGGGDKIHVEWHKEEVSDDEAPGAPLCSLTYVPKKRKAARVASQISYGPTPEDGPTGEIPAGRDQPKPFVIKINPSHYHKLRAMFDAIYQSSEASTRTFSTAEGPSTHAFHAALFAIVIRYSSLSGGQQLNELRGGGMQGAVHDGVFDCLSKWFSASGTECFASPLNSTLSRFHSAFPSPDIDGHFGSHGDFFHSSLDSTFLRPGWYELNPPFSPGVMAKMTRRLGELLDKSCTQDLDVAFIVVIPTVRLVLTDARVSNEKAVARKKKKKKHTGSQEAPEESHSKSSAAAAVHRAALASFRELTSSPYCRSHIVLPARAHGYIEGGQHLRPTHFKESQFSTSVILLRRKEWTGADAELFETELRAAFVSRHAQEVEQRRERAVEKMV